MMPCLRPLGLRHTDPDEVGEGWFGSIKIRQHDDLHGIPGPPNHFQQTENLPIMSV